MVIAFFALLAVGYLSLFHCQLLAQSITTNEMVCFLAHLAFWLSHPFCFFFSFCATTDRHEIRHGESLQKGILQRNCAYFVSVSATEVCMSHIDIRLFDLTSSLRHLQ